MYDILNRMHEPSDVSKLNLNELEQLSEEIRAFLIDSVSRTGGHLASNLGVVELTVALTHVFDFPEDKIVWDVGHQCYVYKLLTGRKDRFDTLRKFGGLSGFPKTAESEYDCFNTGHSSTSVSAALGLQKANRLAGKNAHVIAVLGDGALSGGMAVEALSDAGNCGGNFILILNDNHMSISESVNGLTGHLKRLRTTAGYLTFKSGLEKALSRFPLGRSLVSGLKKIKDVTKHILIGKTVFDDMGFTYFGPVDGHDMDTLTRLLKRAKTATGPVLLHVLTQKGKGYKFAEDSPADYHGVSTFEAEKGISPKHGELTYSGMAGKTLCELGQENDRICVVTAAMAAGTGMDAFSQQFSHRFYDVGIAEQHAVTFSAGLAAGGMIPFVVIYSSFLQRAYDQILHDVCLQNLNVVFLIDRAGIVGEDGETHHGLFDMSYLATMPNMTVFAPADFDEFRQMLTYAAGGSHQGPLAIRYPRGLRQSESRSPEAFLPGKSAVYTKGTDVCLLCAGLSLRTGEKVAESLKEHHISASLVNLRTVHPIDEETVLSCAKSHKVLVTIEDGSLVGGVGERICALLTKKQISCPVFVKAFPPIVPHGSPKELKKLCRMDDEAIAEEIITRYFS